MTDSLRAPLAAAPRETIPVFSGWLGSWQVSVERRPLGAGELSGRYDRVAARWDGVLQCLGLPWAYETLLRRLLPGMWVHLKWRTHRVTEVELERWLRDADLQRVRCLSLRDDPIYRRLSLAGTGRKPRSGWKRSEQPTKRRNPS